MVSIDPGSNMRRACDIQNLKVRPLLFSSYTEYIVSDYGTAAVFNSMFTGILYVRPANERRRYNDTSCLIGWTHTQDDL